MAKVVCIHGIAQQIKSEWTALAQWIPDLKGGLSLAGPRGAALAHSLTDDDFSFAFYGDIFRPAGSTLSARGDRHSVEDLTEYETAMLEAWLAEAERVDPGVAARGGDTLVRIPRSAQAVLRLLSGSAYFSGLAERLLIGSAVQVRRYFTEDGVRAEIRKRLEAKVDAETRVIVAHSLGSVVAYETLCAHPEWNVRALVTLGSPLGVRNLVFDRLRPAPVLVSTRPMKTLGGWPGTVSAWTNVADHGDVVALVKDLRPLFGEKMTSCTVHNGAKAHNVAPYLTAEETGRAIQAGLDDAGETMR